jgi:ACS family hexuronate transporter-like MFS transporter
MSAANKRILETSQMNSSNSPQTPISALPTIENAATVGAQASNFRWVICALLFLATVIAYVDRGVIGYLEKYLETVIGWNTIQYGYITGAFQVAYAIGLVCAGRLTDRLGTRKGFAIAISIWSIAAMLPGAAYSVVTFGVAMFILGLGEAANFPACIKTVAEWFPRRERALATGIFNTGANIGNIVVPLVVPFLVYSLGWRGAFIGTGALGFVWLGLWLWLYAKPEAHPRISAKELALIQSDPPESIQGVPWIKLFPRKETWAFSIAKFLTDPIWWFYLFWLPRYLQGTFHLNLSQSRKPVVAVYLVSIVGSIGGGWISAILLRRGKSPNFSRKMALLICAVAVVPVVWAPFSSNLWVVVGLVGLAAAAHQGWSANLFTLPSDTFPKAAVASIVGIGGMMGAIGGALLQTATGYIVARANGYVPLFVLACSVYLLALLIIQLLAPKLAPAKIE